MRTCLVIICLIICGAVSEFGFSGEIESPKTIMIMPARSGLIFEDSMTVVVNREAIRCFISSHVERPSQALTTESERDYWVSHPCVQSNDVAYVHLLDAYDRSISEHRGLRGSAIKEHHAPQVTRVVQTLEEDDVEVLTYDSLSGIVFVDGGEYDVEYIRNLFPGDVVEYAEHQYNCGVYANAVTRIGWLHGVGIDGGDGDDGGMQGFDYLCVDTPVDSNVADILSGHILCANWDTLFYAPLIGSSSYAKHGTRVCGIVTSDNDTTRGTAYKLSRIFISSNYMPGLPGSLLPYEVKSYSWGVADTDSLFNDTPDVLHCAFGVKNNTEDGYTRFLDSMIDAFDVFLSASAGNYKPGESYNQLYDMGYSYNAIVVNAIDMPDTNRANATLWLGAGNTTVGAWGPASDGRKKPDICVPVVSMYIRDYGSALTVYDEAATSFASPQVTGAGLLLMDRGVTSQRSIKALMLNTTYHPDDMATAEWDTGYGWGLLDANHAKIHADFGDYYESLVMGEGGTPRKRYYSGTFLPFDSDQNAYDRATLVWERHANWSYGDTADIDYSDLTDINLYLYNGLSGALVDSSTSTIDNVEQVYWNSLTDTLGLGVLVVSCDGDTPDGYSYEPFSLATEENFTYYNPSDDLIGIAIDDESSSAAEVYFTYYLRYIVSLEGDAKCDTLWPSLTRVDVNTTILSGPTPECLILAQGESDTICYALKSTTTGQRSFSFKVTTEGYRSTWEEETSTPVAITGTIFDPAPSAGISVTEFTITSVSADQDGAVFRYVSPEIAHVTLEIYDVRGHRISSQQSASPGTEGVLTWAYRNAKGGRVSSGTYLARIITSEGRVVTKKLVVVR